MGDRRLDDGPRSSGRDRGTGRFDGRLAVVTGGARGLGFAIADALLSAGGTVVVADASGAEPAAGRLGRGAAGYTVDVTDASAVEELARRVEAEQGRVSLLVNNAGVCSTEDFGELSVEQWNRLISVNLNGAFYCMRAFLDALRSDGGGSVVNVASLAGRSGGITVSAAYSASKAGVAGLTKAAARQLAKHGVRVNCIAPGTLETDMTATWGRGVLDGLERNVPLGRLGSVNDVVGAVLFLSSPAASYITGVTLDVNGGVYIAP